MEAMNDWRDTRDRQNLLAIAQRAEQAASALTYIVGTGAAEHDSQLGAEAIRLHDACRELSLRAAHAADEPDARVRGLIHHEN